MKNVPFYQFDFNPRFPPFLLYVRCNFGVTFVQRCFRDVRKQEGLCLKLRVKVVRQFLEMYLESTNIYTL